MMRSGLRELAVTPISRQLLLGALLFSCSNVTIAAGEELAQLCRTPPKLIVADSKEEHSPPSTATPPQGTVVLEVTVATDGTIRDALAVKPVDNRLLRWAIEKTKHLRFEPVSKACKTRLTLESRISDGE
jgi:hypothetical protein